MSDDGADPGREPCDGAGRRAAPGRRQQAVTVQGDHAERRRGRPQG